MLAVNLPSSPSSRQLLANISGVMINTDFILDYPRPQPPTFINVGGIQIKPSPGELPDNIRTFIETAEEGVILFTMGFIFNPQVIDYSALTIVRGNLSGKAKTFLSILSLAGGFGVLLVFFSSYSFF